MLGLPDNLKVMSRKTLADRISCMYKELIINLMKVLEGQTYLSATADCWSQEKR